MEIPLSGVKSVRYLPIHVNHLLMFHRCEVPLEINSTIHDKQIHVSQQIWDRKDHHLIEETSANPRQLHKTWPQYRCQCQLTQFKRDPFKSLLREEFTSCLQIHSIGLTEDGNLKQQRKRKKHKAIESTKYQWQSSKFMENG